MQILYIISRYCKRMFFYLLRIEVCYNTHQERVG